MQNNSRLTTYYHCNSLTSHNGGRRVRGPPTSCLLLWVDCGWLSLRLMQGTSDTECNVISIPNVLRGENTASCDWRISSKCRETEKRETIISHILHCMVQYVHTYTYQLAPYASRILGGGMSLLHYAWEQPINRTLNRLCIGGETRESEDPVNWYFRTLVSLPLLFFPTWVNECTH